MKINFNQISLKSFNYPEDFSPEFDTNKALNEWYHTYIEIHSNGYGLTWLNLITIGILLSGIFVLITKNPVVAVLYLIALFLQISGYLFLIGLPFIGLSYILVYIGAVSILFLFILMLINVRISELQSNSSNGLILAFLAGILLYSSIVSTLPINSNLVVYVKTKILNIINNKFIELYDVNLLINDTWDGNLVSITAVSSIGNLLYTSHNMWLIITSTILLLAMVGAIVMTTGAIYNFINYKYTINNLYSKTYK